MRQDKSDCQGATVCDGVWTDPDFDASLQAFYDARVIEIPRPRWTDYDAVKSCLDVPDEPLTLFSHSNFFATFATFCSIQIHHRKSSRR